jgi:predicted nucleotidyltransferase
LEEIKKMIASLAQEGEEFFLFGSQARGDADKRSDYDIAVSCMTGTLPLFRTNHLATSLNTLPWLIDVVDLTRSSDAFRAIIAPDCMKL